METGESSSAGGAGSGNSFLPWQLIPAFKPGITDLTEYSRKMQFLAQMWPQEHLSQLAPRAALLCEGSAFQKLIRIDAAKLKTNDRKGVELLVNTLGGVWGKTVLENKYERFEKAIYATSQRSDETNESYLARHEILFEDVLSQGATFADMRSYILLRNSGLSADDKKKVIVDSGGTLDYTTVTSSIRMLGSRFFQDVQGVAKSTQRTKAYEINHVQEMDDEPMIGEEAYLGTVDSNDNIENLLDAYVADGDEDAILMAQFEDQLIETIQGSEEMSAYMSSYVEARKRLLEKSKFRGFWPVGKGKGFGKGKGKGKNRKTLSQRIAESDCRRCLQRGHWKAECPVPADQLASVRQKNQQRTQQHVANTMMPENDDEDTNDVLFTLPVDFEEFDQVAIHQEAHVVEAGIDGKRFDNHNPKRVNHITMKFRQDCKKLLRRIPNGFQALPRKPTEPEFCNVTTPSAKKIGKKEVLGENITSISSMENFPTDIDRPKKNHESTDEDHNIACFASHDSFGIVDLGASQTVMGRQLVEEFMKSLPLETQERHRVGAVNMTFRFGNNGTVECKQALYIPVGPIWIKIAIVESHTPFLISNNLFRNLKAIIDTDQQQVHFRVLQCTVPLHLSSRKLFLMDMCELITMAAKKNAPPTELNSQSFVFHTSEGKEQSNSSSIRGPSKSESWEKTGEARCSLSESPPAEVNNTSTRSSLRPENSCDSKVKSVQHDPEGTFSHGSKDVIQPGGSIQADPRSREGGGDHSPPQCHVVSTTSGTANSIRKSEDWNSLSRSGSQRSAILPVVPGNLRGVQGSQTHGVCALPSSLHRKDGVGESGGGRGRGDTSRDSRIFHQGTIQRSQKSRPVDIAQSQGTSIDNQLGRDRDGRAGGASDLVTSHGSNGTCSESDCAAIAASVCTGTVSGGSSEPTNTVSGTEAQRDILRSFVEMYNIHSEGNHHGYGEACTASTKIENKIAKEMWGYIREKGYKIHQTPSQCCELIEIYCSADSQLTKQCLKGGSYALRFGLSQGDLSQYENRCKLYDLIIKHRPRNIWMSPKCKAWNKWSQFNASRSTETAMKIMQAREDDLVHLLLCAAIFELQTHRGPSYHFHLEQPVGSDMLYEEPLQAILDNALIARCDMCVAGGLTHPESKRFMQKGTQIITTSLIVHRTVQQWRCRHDHTHDHVAGNYQTSQGHREAVSKYSELYTATFARKILRAFAASRNVQEKQSNPIQWDVNVGEEVEAEAPSTKRRRLEEKQPRPAEFPEPTSSSGGSVSSPELTIDNLISEGQKIAPRVGKIVLEGGDYFHSVQRLFPQHQVRVIEISKGIDRFRKCPVNVRRGEAPYRRSFGAMRNGQIFDSQQWDEWEKWSNRKLTSKCEPMRMMITVFANQKDPLREVHKRGHPIEEEEPEENKRKKTNDPDEAFRELERELSPEETSKPKEHAETPETKHVEHGEKFLALTREEQQWIKKIHKNLGHPNAAKLMNVLRGQKCESRLVDAIPDFHCSTCHELCQPKRARPATLPEDREFNDCIGCDIIVWTNKQGKQFNCLHFIDAATNFHQAVQVHQTDALSLFEGFRQAWLHWAGPCKQMIIDNESGLCSEQFSNLTQGEDIQLRVIAAYAHWQLGKTERHGDILQHMLQKFDHEKAILHDSDFAIALDHCCAAKNSLARHKGYTPEILVLGKGRHLPATNSSDQPDAAHYLAASETPEGVAFRQQLAKRELARRAFVEMDNHDRLRRATLRKHCPHRGQHQSGVRVMFWKPGQGESVGKWVGPAQVIVQESNTVVWISHVSRVYRVPPEHVRLLSEREAQNYLESESNCDQKLPEISKSGIFQYEDLTGESIITGDMGNPANPEGGNIIHTPSNQSDPEGVQPDSEPLCPPSNGTESDGISPSTPPESFIPEAVVPDPAAVPIPDSDFDDELIAEDYWVIQDNCAIKVHNKPRTGPFQPHLDPDCPIDVLSLKPERTSLIKKPSSKTIERKVDRWDNYEFNEENNEAWIGVTVFHVMTTEEEEAYECVEDILTVGPDQYWECEIILNHQDIQQLRKSEIDATAFLVSSAKKQRSEVKLKDLTPEQKKEFDKAKEKEVDQWLSTGTVRAILRDRIPAANILRSRWILTWKDVDEIEAKEIGKSKKAKARLVILGYEDPNLTEIPRDSPTLQKESRSLILQYCASRKWWVRSFDIKTAFLRGSRRDDRILGVDPPEELRRKLGLRPLEICELLKSAYGLVNAPFLWYQELREALMTIGFSLSPLDPCLFTLQGKEGHVHGHIGVHVDDGLCCGDAQFEKALCELERKFPFGTKRERKSTFTGINIEQDTDGRIHLDQREYINNINPINVIRERRRGEDQKVTESERQELRGLIGSLQYAASNTRPDISSRLSHLQSKINCAVIKDLLDGNRLLSDAKRHNEVKITYESIPIHQISFLAYSDASFATREKQQSQKGGLILAAHQDICSQKPAISSPIVWYSKKIDRVVASTLAAETYALSHAVDLVDWLRLSWAWLKNPLIPWKNPEKVWESENKSIAAIDCKSLYDVITKNSTPQCQEHRTLIEALVIKDHVKSGISLHWVHSAAQLADALTKAMDTYALRQYLEKHWCCLHDIDEILKERADRKLQRQWLSTAVTNDVTKEQNIEK